MIFMNSTRIVNFSIVLNNQAINEGSKKKHLNVLLKHNFVSLVIRVGSHER